MNTYAYSAFSMAARKQQGLLRKMTGILDRLSPIGDLLPRLWVAYAFWVSGLTKIQTRDSTL